MNEKIKQLAAGAVFDVIALGRHDGVLFTETELEKFAELIIKECARVCVQENPDPRDSIELQCTNRILKHFGLE